MRDATWRAALPPDLDTIGGWVTSPHELERWAGPGLSWPPQANTLWQEIDAGGTPSFCLDEHRRPIAFGQLVAKGERHCHLARIIVSPDHRRRGLGERLCRGLIAEARRRGATQVTLNVFADNQAARELYRGLGFVDHGAVDRRGIQPMRLG